MICVQKLLKHKITSSRTGSRHIRWSLTGGSQWHGYTTQLFLFRPGSPLGQRWTVHSAHHMARIQSGWKSAQRDANTARPSQSPHRRTESAMAVVRQSQNSPPPPQTPFPGAQDRQNLIRWRWSLPSPIDPVWWRSMHAILSYHGNRHHLPACLPATNTQTGPVTIHCSAS